MPPTGENPAPSRTRTILHWTYLEMARAALDASRRAEKLEKAVLERAKAKGPVTALGTSADADDLFWAEIAFGQRKSREAIDAIVFAAQTLEVYANNIAHQTLSHFYRNTLDKLDLLGKWVIIPKMAFGDGLDPAGDLIGRIRRLQKDRNALVHSHPTYSHSMGFNDPTFPLFWKDAYAKHHVNPERAETALQTCLDAIDAVLQIAPDFDPEYKEYAAWRETARGKMADAATRLEQSLMRESGGR